MFEVISNGKHFAIDTSTCSVHSILLYTVDDNYVTLKLKGADLYVGINEKDGKIKKPMDPEESNDRQLFPVFFLPVSLCNVVNQLNQPIVIPIVCKAVTTQPIYSTSKCNLLFIKPQLKFLFMLPANYM